MHFLPLAPDRDDDVEDALAPDEVTHPLPEPWASLDEDEDDDDSLPPLRPEPEPLPGIEEPEEAPDAEPELEPEPPAELDPLPTPDPLLEPLLELLCDPAPGEVAPPPEEVEEELDALATPRPSSLPSSRPDACLLTNAMPPSPWSTVEPGIRSGEQPTAIMPRRTAAVVMKRVEGRLLVIERSPWRGGGRIRSNKMRCRGLPVKTYRFFPTEHPARRGRRTA